MKILLAGDSTVTEQPRVEPYDFARCYCGWGQMLSRFVRNDTPVLNFAVSGYTVQSFRSACTPSRYELLRANAEAGDYALIQFGHNDQKRPQLRPYGGYAEGLRAYIDELRALHVRPVLVTPLCRNSWHCGTGLYHDLLQVCAEAMASVAAEKDVPLVDLHAISLKWVTGLGRENAKRYFYPGDYTHPNDRGGILFAGMVAQGIAACGHPDIAALRSRLLPRGEWPDGTVHDDEVHTAAGWVYPPACRCRFDGLEHVEAVSICQALQMARAGFAWFVCEHTEATGADYEYACALENGYLPEELAHGFDPDAPCSAMLLKKLMLSSCAGRNAITQEAQHLSPVAAADGSVSGREAQAYALRLQALTTDARDEMTDTEKPAGS